MAAASRSGADSAVLERLAAVASAESTEEQLREPPSQHRRLWLSSTCCAAAEGSASVVGLSSGGVFAYFSLRRQGDYFLVGQFRGCSDWTTAQLAFKTDLELWQCRDLCEETSGCEYYNFQAMGCDGHQAGGCYVFSSCEEEGSGCWDLYRPQPSRKVSSTESPSCSRVREQRGCSNWASLQVGSQQLVGNAGECCSKCGETWGCTAFSYASCDDVGANAKQGRCVLFDTQTSQCVEEDATCWDYYEQDASSFPF